MVRADTSRNGHHRARDERKPLPHDIEAEASILGGVILRNGTLVDLLELEIDDFYLPQHRVVFEAVRNLEAQDKPIDIVMLEHEIAKRGKLEAIGGIAFLGELATKVPTVDNVRAYRDIVQRLSRNRAAILAMASALERAYNWPHDPGELVSEVVGQLARFTETDRTRSDEQRVRWCGDLAAFIGDEEPTDDDAEDWIVRDMVPRAEPVLWGGPMKGGKTWSALDLLIAVALGEAWAGCENTLGEPCRALGMFLEDSRRRIQKRVWELCRGRTTNYGPGYLTPYDERLQQNLRLTRTPIRLPDPKDVRRFVAEIKAWGARFVVIDNLTRVMVGDPNSTRDASAFTRAWCDICEETGASILMLHHTKKPMGGDKEMDPFDTLRGSGDFGAAARNIIVVSPIRQDDGPVLAEIRVRGNLDLRRDGFVLGFERDQMLGKWRARLVDKGEIGTVKEDVRKARKERKAEEKKADFAKEFQRRTDLAMSIVHAEGSISQARLSRALGLASERASAPILNELVRTGVLVRDKYRGYLLADKPRQEGLL